MEEVAYRDLQISEEEERESRLEQRAAKATGDVAATVASLRFAEEIAEECSYDLLEATARLKQLENEMVKIFYRGSYGQGYLAFAKMYLELLELLLLLLPSGLPRAW